MTKQDIIDAIRRTAKANGNTPLGKRKFQVETGIRDTEWYLKFWPRWSDAVREAGFTPNEMTEGYDVKLLLDKLVELTLELGRLPAHADLQFRSNNDSEFPTATTFRQRLGVKRKLTERLFEYVREKAELSAVAEMCREYLEQPDDEDATAGEEAPKEGFVYLMKMARYYKVGFSYAVGRRQYELALQLPESLDVIHAIGTDDPPGIEAYWKERFKAKNTNGEWFDLTRADIAAFKRRKFM